MKCTLFTPSLLAVVLASPTTGNAQSMEMKGMEMKGMKSDTKAGGMIHKGSGTVTEFDPAKGGVTIAHGPIRGLKWPSMTMSFGVRDKALLEKLALDKKFEFVQQGKDYVITAVK